ncbi:heavy metal translocating P-type ATPase [Rhodocyclus tenuis]|uniref:heavy metal translocating P-type ATPase n=1 Tax=Rhodocyclus tenuis TaxID=1066 RepID=UPI001903F49C|nr:heavy metal translocating P-type ATPase [Rhodocyclus tenuis]MBK1680029.1 cation transporter [Rhodocyclus tenuis]
MSSTPCYHCGLPIPLGVDLSVGIDGERRAMCCIGCQAVAQSIVDNGLADYYRHRDALPESPREALPAVLADLRLYDNADFQKSFVRTLGADEREAALLLEGITCSACIWLNEQHLSRLPGVLAADINYATRRARVRWDERRIRLSDILAAVAAIGYRAYPYDPARSEALAKEERRSALWRVFVAGFGMMQVMMYAVPVYFADAGDMSADIEQLMRWASLVLTLPVVLYSAAPFFRGAWRDLRLGRVGMDTPVAIGVGVAFAASVWATLTASGQVYFDSVTMFVFFLLGGRFLEMTARQKAVSVTEALARLLPAFAERLPAYPAQREAERTQVGDLKSGDVVLVRAGATIPADGRVLEGESAADEALLTGESVPVSKRPGDSVIGGATNVSSPLVVAVEAVGEATRLSAIVRLMERAAGEKPRLVELADRVAGRFIAVVLLLAIVTAIVWMLVDPDQALWVTVSVLVVTCPCALSLATPLALTAAGGALAREGVLVTRAHAIETLARATHFVFDKTGTLTLGRMRLLEVLTLGRLDRAGCLALAAALERDSEHPLAAALRNGAAESPAPADGLPDAQALAELRNTPGCGIEALVDGRCLRLGRPDYVAELHGMALPPEAEAVTGSGEAVATLIALGDEQGWLALFRIGDALRPQAAALIADLHAAGCAVTLATGDAWPVARAVAAELGIDDVHAALSPQGKRDLVAALQARGAVVAMLGDGVNDAPVLAQAQVSIAMGEGAPLARTQADLLLLSGNLDHLRQGVRLSRRSWRVIQQNLAWAVVYNALALPLAMGGMVTPWLAGIGMSASSLLVALNSLRLQAQARN